MDRRAGQTDPSGPRLMAHLQGWRWHTLGTTVGACPCVCGRSGAAAQARRDAGAPRPGGAGRAAQPLDGGAHGAAAAAAPLRNLGASTVRRLATSVVSTLQLRSAAPSRRGCHATAATWACVSLAARRRASARTLGSGWSPREPWTGIGSGEGWPGASRRGVCRPAHPAACPPGAACPPHRTCCGPLWGCRTRETCAWDGQRTRTRCVVGWAEDPTQGARAARLRTHAHASQGPALHTTASLPTPTHTMACKTCPAARAHAGGPHRRRKPAAAPGPLPSLAASTRRPPPHGIAAHAVRSCLHTAAHLARTASSSGGSGTLPGRARRRQPQRELAADAGRAGARAARGRWDVAAGDGWRGGRAAHGAPPARRPGKGACHRGVASSSPA